MVGFLFITKKGLAVGTGEITYLVKVFATKPHNLPLIPGTHMVERDKLATACPPPAPANKINTNVTKKLEKGTNWVKVPWQVVTEFWDESGLFLFSCHHVSIKRVVFTENPGALLTLKDWSLSERLVNGSMLCAVHKDPR